MTERVPVFRLRAIVDGMTPPPSLRSLATRAGLDYTTVHAIYSGKVKRADLVTIGRLATALGCEPGELVGWERKVREGKRGGRSKEGPGAPPARPPIAPR